MYVYIYDEFTNQSRFNKLLYKVEKRLTDLGLNGKIVRLGVAKNVKTAVDDEIRQGAKTIIAVGNDATVSRVLNAIAGNQSDKKHHLTLGIIPLEEKNNHIADVLGIKSISAACEILLARRLEAFQLAQINHNFFLFKASIEAPDTILEIDKNYIIQNIKPALVSVVNAPEQVGRGKKLKLNISSKEGESLIFFKEILLMNKEVPVIIDDSLVIKTPVQIRSSEEIIKIIVGKRRAI